MGLPRDGSGSAQPWAAAPLLGLLSLPSQAQQGSAFAFSAPSKWKAERLADFRVLMPSSASLVPA